MIKAIPTEYKGYRFRSRLEARWAVFFDACGADWEYEPEGFDLGDGTYYLPDFLLHGVTIHHGLFKENCDVYVEVKGKRTDDDARKINRFYEAGVAEDPEADVPSTAILVVGNIPAGRNLDEIRDSIWDEAYNDHKGWPNLFNFETIDGDYFDAYPGVNERGVFTLFGGDGSYLGYMDKRKTERAYLIARQARFEHGEKPTIRRYRR